MMLVLRKCSSELVMDLSIIIVNYNTAALVIDCIESIRARVRDIEYEVFVVDNASDDHMCDALCSLGDSVHLIWSEENLGFGRANNLALAKASGRNILFLNPDTVQLDGAVAAMVSFLDTHPDVGVCGVNLYNADNAPTHSMKRRFPSIFTEFDEAVGGRVQRLIYSGNVDYNYTSEPMSVAYVCGADMMVKRSVLDEVGLFDPAFFMYYEDTDLSFRIRKAGYEIFVLPDYHIRHLEGRSFSLNERRELRIFEGRKRFFLNHYSPMCLFLANCLSFCYLTMAVWVSKARGCSIDENKYRFRKNLYKDFFLNLSLFSNKP